MLTRRSFLKLMAGHFLLATGLKGLPTLAKPRSGYRQGVWVNDVHSRLNRTRVAGIRAPDSLAGARRILEQAHQAGQALAVAGARHSGGGQQFAGEHLLIDTTSLNGILHFDAEQGLLEVEAGIQWPEVIDFLIKAQGDQAGIWSVRQKQTGADTLTLGGAVSSNIHSRGLGMKPFIEDLEAVTVLDGQGRLKRCSRTENQELFRLVVGGYGLLGLIYSVTLRLVPRSKIRRRVALAPIDEVVGRLETARRQGALYGDYQFNLDPAADEFLTDGILSIYEPLPAETPIPASQKVLAIEEWTELVQLIHREKGLAFERYQNHYLETDGQVYWSDTHQLGPYREHYHRFLDRDIPASEILTELYVPRPLLGHFMRQVRDDFRHHQVDVIYGTVRLIEADDESFLAWARQDYACIIFNLHTLHTSESIQHSAAAFRRLIDYAIAQGGSYYLTYHRFATKKQLLACYPQFPEFLGLKRKYDPENRFQSDWFRHYGAMSEASAKKP